MGSTTSPRRRVRDAAFAHYPTAKLHGRASIWKAARHQERPVLVYQMGKVGSQAVTRSLTAAGVGPVFQLHVLTDAGIAELEAVYRRNWIPEDGAWHLWRAQHIRRQLARERRRSGPPGERWKVITLVREPVARNLSSFFQVGVLEHGIDRDLLLRADDPEVVAVLAQRFFEVADHDVPLRWFDRELEQVFGIDVYATPFPVDRGWETYSSDLADVLLLRVEDLRSTFPAAIEAFLGEADVPLVAANVSDSKDYGAVYDRVVAEADIPAGYLDQLYASRYARHFYTDAERERFRQRWLRAGTGA